MQTKKYAVSTELKVKKRTYSCALMTFFVLFPPITLFCGTRLKVLGFYCIYIYTNWGLCTSLRISLTNFSVCTFWLKILNQVWSGICQHVHGWQAKHAPTLVRSCLRSNNLLLCGNASSRVGAHTQRASWKGLLGAVNFYYMLRCHVC